MLRLSGLGTIVPITEAIPWSRALHGVVVITLSLSDSVKKRERQNDGRDVNFELRLHADLAADLLVNVISCFWGLRNPA